MNPGSKVIVKIRTLSFLRSSYYDHVVKKFPTFMEPKGSLTYPQEPDTGPCSEPA
jgi:hypothetical protein